MKKKRVLLIGPLPPPIGGDTVSTLNLLESAYWNQSGIEIDHINTSAGNRVRLPFEKRSPRDLFRAIRILSQLSYKLPGTNLVMVWANSGFICTLGLPIIFFSLLMRKPVLVKSFGSFLAERIEKFHPLRKRLVTSALKKSKFVLPETHNLANQLVNITGLEHEHVLQFPSFLPDKNFQAIHEKKTFSGRCVFVGQIKREKGVFEIIEALRGKTDFSCNFFGQLVDRDRDTFMEEISRAGNLEYSGIVNAENVTETIRGYDVLLLPTYHIGEGYPVVILQGFAANVPVIATDWKTIPEIVMDGTTGILVPVKSAEGIMDALERLASDNMLYDSIAANAFGFVKEFSEKLIVKDLLIAKISGLL